MFEILTQKKKNSSVARGNKNGLIHLKHLYFIWSFIRKQSLQENFFLEAHSWRTTLKIQTEESDRGKIIKHVNLRSKG